MRPARPLDPPMGMNEVVVHLITAHICGKVILSLCVCVDVRVFLSVCLFVRAITFESPDIETFGMVGHLDDISVVLTSRSFD